MSDSDSFADEELDRWLADHHRELAHDIAATLDVEAGLGEALISAHHADLVTDLGRTLDVEAGLNAIVAQPGALSTSNPSSGTAEHIAAAGPVHTQAKRPRWRTNQRKRLQTRSLIIAAAVLSVLAVITPLVSSKIFSSPPTPATRALDLRDYGVIANTDVGTVVFTVAIRAEGAGTVEFTVQPEPITNQPVRDENLVFNGPLQTKKIVYAVPYTCSSGEHLQGGLRIVITKPESTSGASYAPYDIVCPERGR
jgi:hypothetical protein